ncbi:MAG: PKD domain-containing protein [Bacteroidetes bacterium]|nr:PKD domain-containing protein [Bacteroidota bacterium]
MKFIPQQKGYGNFYYATGRSYFQGSASQGMRPTFTKFNNLGNIQFSKYLLYSITANARIYGIDIVYSNDSLLIGYFGDKITGTSTNYSVGIIKTDTAANVIWSKDYNITSSTNEYSYKVLVTNYGYAIVGYMPGAVNKNFYIIAVNKVGNLLWAKSYGTSAVEDILYTNTPIACSEGSTIYFTGRTTTSNGKMDLVIVKVDSLGNTNCNTGVTLSINVTTNPTNSNSCTLSTAIDNLVFTSVNNSNQNTVIDPCSTTLLNLGNDTTVCDSIILNATLPGTNQYFWSNGSTQSTIKIFSPGIYWVNVFSNCCMYTDTIHILNSLSLPVATISGNTSICKGDSTNLLVSGGSSYLWNNGATDSLLTVKPIVTTMYTVVAKNGSCSSVPDTVIVTVLQPPLFNLIGDSISCNSSSVQLIAICPTALTTHWSPGILSTNDTITISSNIPGYFSAYVFDGTCKSQLDSIWVDTLSSPTISANFIPLSCINDTIQFSSVTNATSLVWNFGHTASGASNTSNLSNPSHIYTSAGNFTINLVAQNYCGSTSFNSPITIQSGPPVSLTNDTTICKGNSISLNASGGTNYQWSGAVNSTASSVLVSPLVNSTYLVKTSNGSCFGPLDSVTVSVAVQPLISLVGDSISCNSGPVQLIANCPSAQAIHWSSGISSTNDTIAVSTGFPAFISAYAFDGICNSKLDSIWVDTLSSPTLSASFITLSCMNDTVHFSSITNATSLTWNFGHTASGASNTSNLSNPSHIYTSAGNFTINLVAQNYCGSTSFNSPITIQSGPPVSLTNDTTICKGNSISLIASGGTNYQWSGAVNSTASSVLVSPLVNSTYLVKTSNGSCFGPLDSVTVSVAVQPLISLVGDSISCNSGPVQLIANCPSAQAIHWSSGISSTNDTIAVSTGFPAFISAYAFDGICNSKLDSIWVDTLSSPTLNASFITLSCMNDTVHFSSITNATSLTWNFGHTASGASNTSNLSNPSHIYTSAGNFTINLVAQNYCGSTSYASPITVQVGPQVQVPNDTTICKGQSVNLIAAGGTNYVWDGAISSNASSVLVAPLVTSTYIVKASNGTCFGIPDTIVVNPIDKPIVLVSGIDTVCNSELITLTATGASTYFWNGASGTSVDTIQVAPNVNSTYSVVGAIGACLSDTSFFKVTVSNISHADYSYSLDTCSGEILFLNKSSLANSYKWIFGDSYESSLMHPVHTYSESGTFQTMLITNPGKSCSDTLIDEIKYEQNPEGYLLFRMPLHPMVMDSMMCLLLIPFIIAIC